MGRSIDVDPGAVAAQGSSILSAADELAGLRGELSARSFGGADVESAESGYRDFVSEWKEVSGKLADAVESLGDAVRTAAQLYRETDGGAVRRP